MLPLTVGVEEEFHLLDVESGALVSRSEDVLAALPPSIGRGAVMGELPLSQVETATPVCRSLAEAADHVRRLRAVAAEAAAAAGCVLVSAGTAPIADVSGQSAARGPRYDALHATAHRLVAEQLIAGLHVHVGGVVDAVGRDGAVEVVDRLRPWLPVLVAVGANSPYWLGHDTGFASWRSVHWGRWPVSGPPPAFGSAAAYDAEVDRMVALSVIADRTKIYWSVRLSERYPTIEVRVTDACLTVSDTVLIVELVLGLVRWALRKPALAPYDDALLRAACWQAARDGLSDCLVDPLAPPRLVPAAAAVAALTGAAGPLDPLAALGLERVLREGTGADRQRAAYARGGFPAVVRLLASATLEP